MMIKKSLCFVLIICFGVTFCLIEPTYAFTESSSSAGNAFFVAFIVMVFITVGIFSVMNNAQKTELLNKEGWIEANKTTKQKFLLSDLAPFPAFAIKIKNENGTYIYSTPDKISPIGYAFYNEKYNVEKETTNDGLWYKIIFKPNHLLTFEAKSEKNIL